MCLLGRSASDPTPLYNLSGKYFGDEKWKLGFDKQLKWAYRVEERVGWIRDVFVVRCTLSQLWSLPSTVNSAELERNDMPSK